MARSDTKTSETKTSVSVMDVNMDKLNEEQIAMMEATRESFGIRDDIPDRAITTKQYAEFLGLSSSAARARLAELTKSGEWDRGRKAGGQSYYYWKK